MFERFDDEARDVMELAVCETGRLNHEYLGTEHILLGLTKGSGVAIDILMNLNVGLREIRAEVEKIIHSNSDPVMTRELAFTPRAKRVVENAGDEARMLNHSCIGTEHILLGLLRDQKNVAFQILTHFGVNIEDVRRQALNLHGESSR